MFTKINVRQLKFIKCIKNSHEYLESQTSAKANPVRILESVSGSAWLSKFYADLPKTGYI